MGYFALRTSEKASERNQGRGLDELFPFILPERNGLVAVIGGYFDESMRTQGNEPICVGGILFKPSGYKKFKRQWNKNVLWLRGHRFKHFHMTDLCAGKQEYEGVSIDDRVTVLDNALNAISENMFGALAVHFDQAEFERKAPTDWPQQYGSIYTAACEMCLQVTGYWLHNGNVPMDVLYVFERGHRFQDEADRLLSAIGNVPEARQRFRYRNHVFEPKTEMGLQAADFYAWMITKAIISSGSVPSAFRPFVGPVTRWVKANNARCRLHQFTGDKLDRFFAEFYNNAPLVQAYIGRHKRAFR